MSGVQVPTEAGSIGGFGYEDLDCDDDRERMTEMEDDIKQYAALAVLKNIFNFDLGPLSGGVPGEGPDCHFP